jgi:hypothetical protein
MPLFKAKLLWGQSYTLFCLICCGHELPTEKVRDHGKRLNIMYSASPYALGEEQCRALEEADPLQLKPYLLGMAKAAQQSLKYLLSAKANHHFNQFVFTRHGVLPRSEIRLNLGLVGEHAEKSFMDM